MGANINAKSMNFKGVQTFCRSSFGDQAGVQSSPRLRPNKAVCVVLRAAESGGTPR